MASYLYNNNNADYRIKITLLGCSGVGKSSIIEKYMYDVFNYNIQTTIGTAFQYRYVSVDDKKLKIIINDTAGQEKYNSIPKMYYRDVNAFVIVYDVTDKQTYENLEYWLRDVKENGNSNCDIYVIGNKIDYCKELRMNTPEKISAELKDICVKLLIPENSTHYMEVSALTGNNINQLFDTIINNCINGKKYDNIAKDNNVTIQTEKSSCC
ncbi:Ras family GTPase [Catovirus CTV1]|uniref:Ras family GTPase n=1 Tax=Catovirus CTV1 TaxID=1977631 RepID=A0A1V0SAG1_9VIRU|nr:Ras family GTPase [Catovirus CTV1]